MNVFMLAWGRPGGSDWNLRRPQVDRRQGGEGDQVAGQQTPSAGAVLEGVEEHPGRLLHRLRGQQRPPSDLAAEEDMQRCLRQERVAGSSERLLQRLHLLLPVPTAQEGDTTGPQLSLYFSPHREITCFVLSVCWL